MFDLPAVLIAQIIKCKNTLQSCYDHAGKLFSDAGLVPDMKVLASGSKVLSFTKPLPKV